MSMETVTTVLIVLGLINFFSDVLSSVFRRRTIYWENKNVQARWENLRLDCRNTVLRAQLDNW